MIILIVSDSHGYHKYYKEMCQKEKGIDLVLHLGDVEDDDLLPELKAYTNNVPFYAVKGNHDFNTSLPEELLLDIAGEKVWMVHSHQYMSYYSRDVLAKEGKKRGATIVLYGHTHVAKIDEIDGIYVINPGSISYPRDYHNLVPSYIIWDTDKDKEHRFELKSLSYY